MPSGRHVTRYSATHVGHTAGVAMVVPVCAGIPRGLSGVDAQFVRNIQHAPVRGCSTWLSPCNDVITLIYIKK